MTKSEETVKKWKIKVPKGRCLNDGTTHFKKGCTPWNKGIAMSDKTKEKISKSKKANPTRYWLDKKRSENTKRKISESKLGSIPWNKNKHQLQTTGDKNPNWKGGRSKGYKTGYYSLEYKQWRTSVFEKDNYKCKICGVTGVYLTAHHIKSFARFPKLRFEISNGMTLCEDCHKSTDNYKGRC